MSRTSRIVAGTFIGAVAVLGIASWDIARGRAPETASPLIIAVLNTPEDRRCARDVSTVVGRYLTPGMARREAENLLAAATVAAPAPWFWTPVREDRLESLPDRIRFTRTMRFTAFGNQKVEGEAVLDGDAVRSVTARTVCAFG
jgi:hypothetical protein